ncbi:unnamed protein product [Amoebophrya sp. A25]|nr:unnamed protein product [Amoebophrya sp. A25]|eukprot:GSA25T00024706001.1
MLMNYVIRADGEGREGADHDLLMQFLEQALIDKELTLEI